MFGLLLHIVAIIVLMVLVVVARTGILSCGFWYAVLLLVTEVMVGIILAAIATKILQEEQRRYATQQTHICREILFKGQLMCMHY